MENVNTLIEDVRNAGFDAAIAIATEAEIKADAACGMMCLVNEVAEEN